MTVSPNVVLSQLEREPDEAVVDPWVVERRTLVAVRSDAVAAAVHLLRYGEGHAVGPVYRRGAEVADPSLPAPATYGVCAGTEAISARRPAASSRSTGRRVTSGRT